jgi:hypothetical protein
VYSNDFDDHGGRRGDTVQTLAQWHHPVASSEALDVLNWWAMRPASYLCIYMAIKIASDSPTFLVVLNLLSPTTIAK